MATGEAAIGEKIFDFKFFFEAVAFDGDSVVVDGGLGYIASLEVVIYLLAIDHAATGGADDLDIVSVDLVFLEQDDEAAGITGFGDDSGLVAAADEVLGEVVFAERVPDEAVDLIGFGDEAGGGAEGSSLLLIADDYVHQLFGEQFSRFISNFGL